MCTKLYWQRPLTWDKETKHILYKYKAAQHSRTIKHVANNNCSVRINLYQRSYNVSAAVQKYFAQIQKKT